MSCRYSGSRSEVYIVVVACGLLLVVQMQMDRLESRMLERLIDAQCRCKANAMRESNNTNQVTIHADDREKTVRDILKKRGEIE